MAVEGPGTSDERRRRHRALANVNRVGLMRLLEDGPREVTSLARVTGLHHNTVRAHLDVLVDAGLVERTRQPAGRPGRPAWSYGLADAPAGGAPATDRKLTMVLADALQRVADDPAFAAEAAGLPWGREVVAGEQLEAPGAAIQRVVEMLHAQGFAPELRSDDATGRAQVLLHACPYDALAERYGEVVCAVHLGLIRGALDELGAPVRVDLRPKVQTDLCITELDFGRERDRDRDEGPDA